jgi:hypothetical protein
LTPVLAEYAEVAVGSAKRGLLVNADLGGREVREQRTGEQPHDRDVVVRDIRGQVVNSLR